MHHPLLAYIGPETMLPLASGLAAVLGGLLFCWRWVAGFFRSMFSAILPGKKGGEETHAEPAGEVNVTAPVAAPTAPAGTERTGTLSGR